jgi:hypothetical protein
LDTATQALALKRDASEVDGADDARQQHVVEKMVTVVQQASRAVRISS